MNEREYKRLRQQIQDDCKRKLEALDLVWQMAGPGSRGDEASEAPIRRGAIDGLVRQVVPLMKDAFTPRHVMERINELPDVPAGINRSSVSSALKRLADEGQIDVVETGRGKRASRYRAKSGVNVRSSVATTPVWSSQMTVRMPLDVVEPEPEPEMESFDEGPMEPVEVPGDDDE
jgi:hypothetical protein